VHLARLRVAPKEQIPRVQIVYPTGAGGVCDYPAILASRAQTPHRAILSEQKLQDRDVLGTTLVAPVKNVTGRAVTYVRTIRVLAQLLAEAPLGALVSIWR